MITVEYSVKSRRFTSKVVHELLFSVAKKRFIIPAKRDKENDRLIYYLLPGRYLKFSLFALTSLNSALFKLTLVVVNIDGKVEENVIYEYGLHYSELGEIERDPNAPRVLVKFIEMLPAYHHMAYVKNTDDIYDPSIDAIKYYLENKKTEVEDL